MSAEEVTPKVDVVADYMAAIIRMKDLDDKLWPLSAEDANEYEAVMNDLDIWWGMMNPSEQDNARRQCSALNRREIEEGQPP